MQQPNRFQGRHVAWCAALHRGNSQNNPRRIGKQQKHAKSLLFCIKYVVFTNCTLYERLYNKNHALTKQYYNDQTYGAH